MDSAKIYINGELLGYCKDPESFTNEMRFIYSMTLVGKEDH